MTRAQPFLTGVLLFGCVAMASFAGAADMSKVDAAFARKPVQTGNVARYGFPRSDLKVVLDGVDIKPGLALGGWVAIQSMDGPATVMGDLVLTESEVNPVLTALLAHGLEVTGLHNHLLRAEPPTFYMHICGHGDPATIAQTIRAALASTGTPLEASPAPAEQPPLDLPTAKLDETLGAKGKAAGGVYQFSVPRTDQIQDGDMTVPPAMGVANALNFQPLGGGTALAAGDIVATAKELGPLLRALRAQGLEVAAIHNHMLREQPRMFFVHFLGRDDAFKLAQALRAALETTSVAPKP